MKPVETKRLYERACREKRRDAKQDEMNLWHRVLRGFEVRDVESALDAWWASTDRDEKGELRSKWLPSPAELKPLAIAAQRKREAAERIDFCGNCALGWVSILRDRELVKVPCECRERVLTARRAIK